MLDAALWEVLQQHGVLEEHLRLLARALELQKTGSLAWHFAHGNLTQCDLRLTFAARQIEVTRVADALLDGVSVAR
jgi:hypothetical protein